jgi:FkbM family methyltransferase
MINRILTKIFRILNIFPRQKFATVSISKKASFLMSLNSSHDEMRYRTFFSKEPEMLDWLNSLEQNFLSKTFVFYDIGANVGIYSLYLAAINNTCSIYSFEPESSNYFTLNTNIHANSFYNIKPILIALSSESRFSDLHVSILESGAGAAAVDDDYKHTNNKSIHKQSIYKTSLNDLVNDPYFKFPNFIKIDVDGHEADIISGAQKVLLDSRLKGLIIEYEYSCESDKQKFIDDISLYGFQLELESNWVDTSSISSVSIQNFIFTRV